MRKIIVLTDISPSIGAEITEIGEGNDWRSDLHKYLSTKDLLEDKRKVEQVKARVVRFRLIGGLLCKTTFSLPYLRCLSDEERAYVLREIHEGACGAYIRGRALTKKVVWAGHFWSKWKKAAEELVKKCDSFQRHISLIHQPAELLGVMSSPCPFAIWGIDIVGPFPMATGQRKFIIMAVDYFSKWVEVEPMEKISASQVRRFMWKKLVSRFGWPRDLVSDNGAQFQGRKFRKWLAEMKVRQFFTSVAHSQANGQVEVTNRSVVKGIKARLEIVGGGWVDELHSILWFHRTTPKEETGETHSVCYTVLKLSYLWRLKSEEEEFQSRTHGLKASRLFKTSGKA
ncbi:hypothetical protein DH2020_003775 [Rehmannia glutinosa]|uniref:Integrase catalytic domain-containing protein n=1 Tax=Rehmannia glutinosa TaxID=99300 RepID=A0ABR0XMJ8_REHGL